MRTYNQTFDTINITPLTDVFIVLLVIMILVTNLDWHVLKVTPPMASTKDASPSEKTIAIHVADNGSITVDGHAVVPPDSLHIQRAIEAILQRTGNKDMPIVLSSSLEAHHKDVVAVMDAAQGAQIKRLGIIDPPKDTNR